MGRNLLIISMLCAATACDKIPGTEAHKLRTSMEGARAAAAYGLIDPSSAQFRDVTVSNDFACGEVNGKNRLGAYVGFIRFTASREDGKWTAELDPQFDDQRFKQVQQDCQTAAALHNPALAQLSCHQAMDMAVEQSSQSGFDFKWKNFCHVNER